MTRRHISHRLLAAMRLPKSWLKFHRLGWRPIRIVGFRAKRPTARPMSIGSRHASPRCRSFSRRPSVPALSAFEYAIVRVVPHVEREEFVNVGAIVFCATHDYLAAR